MKKKNYRKFNIVRYQDRMEQMSKKKECKRLIVRNI